MNNKVLPAVVQVECHPFYQQEELLTFLKEHHIQMEAWGSFAEGKKNIFENPILKEIGQKYGKTTAQVILRWNIQRGIIPLTKSIHSNRIKENLSVLDFELSQEDMKSISQLDENKTLFGRNEDPEYAQMINNVKIHGE